MSPINLCAIPNPTLNLYYRYIEVYNTISPFRSSYNRLYGEVERFIQQRIVCLNHVTYQIKNIRVTDQYTVQRHTKNRGSESISCKICIEKLLFNYRRKKIAFSRVQFCELRCGIVLAYCYTTIAYPRIYCNMYTPNPVFDK